MKHGGHGLKALILSSSIVLFFCQSAVAEVITSLPDPGKNAVALTFDACETKTPSHFDKKVLDYLVKEKIPFTVFITGRFAERNKEDILRLAELGFVELENHSRNHVMHMEALSEKEVLEEISDNVLKGITGKKTKFFRFPAGNYDQKTLELVERKYKVVHWTFPSGDPDKNITAEMLVKSVTSNTRPGDILIFHINGRGYGTAEALPEIVERLRKRGLHFVKLEEIIQP
ncbi:MAG: polysaccharide deacetylase [Deltaproteobacteria bacterium GWC2_55_46]|nr:MAG: polysaccharide deacetylase [Deltaproteobacteria bacterium GWA2_55_82]OGQ62039.1 MAG: polysaccharide deacetylase [Deltaproteobacteria bacterium RIFCSPLOWO2_02_FULL_55_12]OIJ74104.1 MAG: polysaccharide deacetylase [Deltaproteobacteria bacterium GWC2_55_46]